MSKRSRDNERTSSPAPKRLRATADRTDRLSSLSDELLIQILSFLPIPSLITCQRLSRRFHSLAGDSELWKRLYYSRWVWPRARRLANSKHSISSQKALDYSPRVSKWLGHGHLMEEGRATNWKRQYRLRHNWSKGSCRVSEVEVAQPPVPQILVKLYAGMVFTADSDCGLRVWSTRCPSRCLASFPFQDVAGRVSAAPTALAAAKGSSQNSIEVTVGFEDGRFMVYELQTPTLRLVLRLCHAASSGGAVTAVASSSPYVLMISQHKVLSLYELPWRKIDTSTDATLEPPRRVASLTANNIFAPISLSIRNSASEIVASIAYSFYRVGCGWSLGIQELRLSNDGEHLGSRLATTVDSQYGTDLVRLPIEPGTGRRHGPVARQFPAIPAEPSILHNEPPTSLSYSHPYLLSSHADNTLTMYLVVSTSNALSIKGGRRLWGHTSSVSGVQVSERGKAVSVGARGHDIRIWELEAVASSPFSSQRSLQGDSSVQVSPENKHRRKSVEFGIAPVSLDASCGQLRSVFEDLSEELSSRDSWIGFDEEQVIVLRERGVGTQLLECYDFT
ncbi:F-box domain protein [Paecilomyces variotii]|uniref:Probable E3 ubiquitin ligase complex SCF subunit sconB n=1 Tax=Byssochlamys spectabilis TaxID=264951 RepID=A0A443HTE4_BYSSP|nr:F-box domain protein [Paecilomyces variotii]RWQ95087.1 F-box domain protein [Paecilomyces variotii]